MPTKRELERIDLTGLAVLCQKVAEDPSASGLAADQGRGLKQEWTLLTHSITPPLPALKEQQQIEAETVKLKRRMVDFLAAIL